MASADDLQSRDRQVKQSSRLMDLKNGTKIRSENSKRFLSYGHAV